jgi:hypothetical protein
MQDIFNERKSINLTMELSVQRTEVGYRPYTFIFYGSCKMRGRPISGATGYENNLINRMLEFFLKPSIMFGATKYGWW